VHNLEVNVGPDVLRWVIESALAPPVDDVLLDHDDDLIAATTWSDVGYSVEPFLPPELGRQFRAGIRDLVVADLESIGVEVPDGFTLDRYHEVVTTDEQHLEFVGIRRGFYPMELLPVPLEIVESRLSEILGVPVRRLDIDLMPPSFAVRVVRPRSRDNSPPHRDVWLSWLRHTVGSYIPIAGHSDRASLPVLPGSHRWPESATWRTEGNALVDGTQHGVPVLAGAPTEINMIRPEIGPDELLVFSAYAIHGGARNLQDDATRVSCEIRVMRDDRV